jgi:hypothetical protein
MNYETLYAEIIQLRKELKNNTQVDEQIKRLQLDNINMQFKYDIALNMVENDCGRYHINTLENADAFVEMEGFNFDSATETLRNWS